jgi:hypothetical protein
MTLVSRDTSVAYSGLQTNLALHMILGVQRARTARAKLAESSTETRWPENDNEAHKNISRQETYRRTAQQGPRNFFCQAHNSEKHNSFLSDVIAFTQPPRAIRNVCKPLARRRRWRPLQNQ